MQNTEIMKRIWSDGYVYLLVPAAIPFFFFFLELRLTEC